MRVQMIIPDDLLAQIDGQAAALGITRTAYVVMSMSQKVQSEIMLKSMPDMQRLINDVQLKLAAMNQSDKTE